MVDEPPYPDNAWSGLLLWRGAFYHGVRERYPPSDRLPSSAWETPDGRHHDIQPNADAWRQRYEPDWERYLSLARWSLHEALCLALPLAPEHLDDYRHQVEWRRRDDGTGAPHPAAPTGPLTPPSRHPAVLRVAPAADAYDDLADRYRRAHPEAGNPTEHMVTPSEWIEWLSEQQAYPLPDRLAAFAPAQPASLSDGTDDAPRLRLLLVAIITAWSRQSARVRHGLRPNAQAIGRAVAALEIDGLGDSAVRHMIGEALAEYRESLPPDADDLIRQFLSDFDGDGDSD